jgi:hypothetical protein
MDWWIEDWRIESETTNPQSEQKSSEDFKSKR